MIFTIDDCRCSEFGPLPEGAPILHSLSAYVCSCSVPFMPVHWFLIPFPIYADAVPVVCDAGHETASSPLALDGREEVCHQTGA